MELSARSNRERNEIRPRNGDDARRSDRRTNMVRAMSVEITVFTKSGGPLTKKIELRPDGTVKSDGSECRMAQHWRSPLSRR